MIILFIHDSTGLTNVTDIAVHSTTAIARIGTGVNAIFKAVGLNIQVKCMVIQVRKHKILFMNGKQLIFQMLSVKIQQLNLDTETVLPQQIFGQEQTMTTTLKFWTTGMLPCR